MCSRAYFWHTFDRTLLPENGTTSQVFIVAAGVGQKSGETRLKLLQRNAAVFRAVVLRILHHAPEEILLVATNPVDVMTHIAARLAEEAGVSNSRVLGSGTTLDTACFRTLLGHHFVIDSASLTPT